MTAWATKLAFFIMKLVAAAGAPPPIFARYFTDVGLLLGKSLGFNVTLV
jgi:hypothetical protein